MFEALLATSTAVLFLLCVCARLCLEIRVLKRDNNSLRTLLWERYEEGLREGRQETLDLLLPEHSDSRLIRLGRFIAERRLGS
jgi:hypothetical protein